MTSIQGSDHPYRTNLLFLTRVSRSVLGPSLQIPHVPSVDLVHVHVSIIILPFTRDLVSLYVTDLRSGFPWVSVLRLPDLLLSFCPVDPFDEPFPCHLTLSGDT